MFLASSLWQVFVFTLLGSGKFVEKVCDEWVLSASVCVARSPVDFCSATDRKSTRLNSSHSGQSRMPSSA